MSLGNSLFNARKKSGLSQEAVAEKLGVSRQTISKWELDETLPDIRQSKKLSQLYHLTLDELIDFDIDQKEIEEAIENISNKKQQKIDVKEIQLSYRIDTHDFETKVNHARRFLSGGNKVKVAVRFKGREMSHTAIGLEVINRLGEACKDISVIEKAAALDGRQMIMFLAPKAAQTAKPKKQKAAAKEAESEE